MTTIAAWKLNFLRVLKQGHPLETAATICGIGKDKIIYERQHDAEFDEEVKNVCDSNTAGVRVRF